MLDAFPGRFISEILAELNRLPVALVDEVLEARSYQRAHAMVEAADTPEARKRLPRTAFFGLVDEIENDLIEEARRPTP